MAPEIVVGFKLRRSQITYVSSLAYSDIIETLVLSK